MLTMLDEFFQSRFVDLGLNLGLNLGVKFNFIIFEFLDEANFQFRQL
jgi:hypothetical protein